MKQQGVIVRLTDAALTHYGETRQTVDTRGYEVNADNDVKQN
jgi:hypothetical protein